MRDRTSRVAIVLAGLFLFACGGTGSHVAPIPTRPWNDSLAEPFDDGVDFVAPLRSILGTPWFDEYGEHLERRLEEADVVAVVALRSVVPAAGRQAFGAVEVEVVEALAGSTETGATLRLDVAVGSDAAARLDELRPRIEEVGRFVAYVQLYTDPLGEVRAHWHLSPEDADLLSVIQRVLQPAPAP